MAPVTDPESVATVYFPLPGLQADDDRVPIGDMVLFRPTHEEWRLVEKTDVADLGLAAAMMQSFGFDKGVVRVERNGRVHYEYVEDPAQQAAVPWCLVRTWPWDDGDGQAALATIRA